MVGWCRHYARGGCRGRGFGDGRCRSSRRLPRGGSGRSFAGAEVRIDWARALASRFRRRSHRMHGRSLPPYRSRRHGLANRCSALLAEVSVKIQRTFAKTAEHHPRKGGLLKGFPQGFLIHFIDLRTESGPGVFNPQIPARADHRRRRNFECDRGKGRRARACSQWRVGRLRRRYRGRIASGDR
jgi:hypothetical protein